MTHRQDKKYATEANGITEHGSNGKQTSKEHPLSPPHVQLSPQSISIFTLLTVPSDTASCSTQTESRGQMERATNNRVKMEVQQRASEQTFYCTGLWWKHTDLTNYRSQCENFIWVKCPHICKLSASKMNVLLVSIPRLGKENNDNDRDIDSCMHVAKTIFKTTRQVPTTWLK